MFRKGVLLHVTVSMAALTHVRLSLTIPTEGNVHHKRQEKVSVELRSGQVLEK